MVLQISSAFKNFGVSADEGSCLVAKLADNDSDCADVKKVCSMLCARQLPPTSIRDLNVDDRIKKVGN